MEREEKNLDSIYDEHHLSEKEGCLIPLTTIIDDEVNNSSHQQSNEIE
jgi:hypothetical protein